MALLTFKNIVSTYWLTFVVAITAYKVIICIVDSLYDYLTGWQGPFSKLKDFISDKAKKRKAFKIKEFADSINDTSEDPIAKPKIKRVRLASSTTKPKKPDDSIFDDTDDNPKTDKKSDITKFLG